MVNVNHKNTMIHETKKQTKILVNTSNGGIPKWLKGPVSKAGRSEMVQGFESPFLRHKRTRIVIREICHNFFIFRAKKAKNAEFDTV